MVCLDNRGNEFSLDIGKVYRVANPLRLDPESMLRIYDNEGEDYLYNSAQFLSVEVAAKSKKILDSVLVGSAGHP